LTPSTPRSENSSPISGNDGGQTKREYLDDINETLLETNVFLYSPVIEAGVDITVPVKKVYGILSANSNSQRAFMQMINRCRRVEEPRMDFLKGEGLDLNNNYNFWTFKEIMHLNRHTVDATRAEFIVDDDGELKLKENALNKQRKTISVYNTVEEKNKHPSLFINYLKVLAASKGIKFEVQARPEEQEGAKQKKKKSKKNAKIEQILTAKDLDEDEFEELSLKKKAGKTTTAENYQVEKHYWQKRFSTKDVKEEILVNFLYGQDPFKNFLALIDQDNHRAEDNLRSDKQLEKVQVINRLLELLGWKNARDESQLNKESVRENFAEKVVKDPLFKNQKRLNELFDLAKTYNIYKDMKPQQILMWANSLLKPFSLQIKAGEKVYRLELQNDLLNLIARKNKEGRLYKDSKGLLNQMVPEKVAKDLFMDDETKETKYQFSQLDVGVNLD
jgi:hypothetical protein